jgi:hypothetical protein
LRQRPSGYPQGYEPQIWGGVGEQAFPYTYTLWIMVFVKWMILVVHTTMMTIQPSSKYGKLHTCTTLVNLRGFLPNPHIWWKILDLWLWWCNEFFGGEFLPFCEKYFQKQLHWKVKKKKNSKNSPKTTTTTYNMIFLVLKIFLFSYFEYCQIWQNTRIDNHHLSNIIKLKKRHWTSMNTPNPIWNFKLITTLSWNYLEVGDLTT